MRVHAILFALSFVFGAQAVQAQFSTNGSSIYYNNGNVGIGNSSPNALLELKKSISGGLGPVLRLTGGGSSGAQCAIDLSTYDAGSNLPGGRIIATDNGSYSCSLDFQVKQSGAMGNGMLSRLFLRDNGNVGIGTNNPLAPLHVYGGITANNGSSVIYDKGSMSNQFYCSFYGNSLQQAFLGTPADVSNRLDLGTGNTTIAMTLLNNNVGIGTTNPACRLHVSGGTLAASSDDALSGFVQLWADNAVIFKAGNASGLRFGTATDLSAANWSEKMRITTAGYVGIGTSNPTEALEVTGNIKSAGIVLPTGAAAGKVLTSDANGVASWQTVSSSGSTGWTLSGSTSVASGYVTIGTGSLPASDALLAVKGNVYAQKVKVTQTGWSDYVFDPGYKLRPLNEVENYIQQQHHLPEVPSAAAVEKDGIDVGDNQATLLKKIEELTLYMIEQNKTLQNQQKLIEQQALLLKSQQQQLDALNKQVKK